MTERAMGQRPRSLADDLRARDDAALQALLSARLDLLNPVPSDIASLAARAASRPSVQRALDELDLFHLQVVDALCAVPDPVDVMTVVRLVGAEAELTFAALSRLREQALLYGQDNELTVVRTVRDVVGPPAGLGPAVEQLLATYGPARLEQLLVDLGLPGTGDAVEAARHVGTLFRETDILERLFADAPDQAVEAARTLAAGPPTGRLDRARRGVDAASAATPVEWLLARGLLVAVDDSTVALPREVALHLRGGRISPPQPVPPQLDAVSRDAKQVERAAAGAAFTAVRLVEDLLELWSVDPPKALRAGGLGVRERARAAAAIDVSDDVLSLLVEVAHVAGLVEADLTVDAVWLPTSAYDRWADQGTAERWATLVGSWLNTTRVAGLAGTTDQRGRTLTALGPELDRGLAPQLRRAALSVLDEAPPGAAAGVESVVSRLTWHAPRRGGRLRDDIVRWTLHEAELLGVTGRGAMTAAARALLTGDENRAAACLDSHLPKPLEHVLIQADLTAVAPGPLTRDLAQRLRLVADVESTGGATVYRFSEASVRRALDFGWSAEEVLGLLERHSRTPVPQPLSYLVQDVARRHGRIRVGTASAYVRCDDEALVAEIVANRRLAPLHLRRLAPTVVAAQAPVETVLSRLRELGYAPAAEGKHGDVVVRRRDARRSAAPRPPIAAVPDRARPQPALLMAAVRGLRGGDRALTAVKRRAGDGTAGDGAETPIRRPMADVLATLQQAARSGDPVWVGYVNAEGHASQRIVEPISVEGGYVSAYDHLRDEVRTFSLHRITGISALDD